MTTKEKETYTTIDGVTLETVAVSPFLLEKVRQSVYDRLRNDGILIDCPTYEVKTAAGNVEIHEHNEKTIADQATPDEDRELWEKYQAGLKLSTTEAIEKVTEALLLRGVKFDLPKDDGWKEEQEFLGVTIPEKMHELKLHYLTTELVKSAADIIELVSTVTRHTGVSEEALAAAEASFRGALGESDEPAEEGNTAQEA
jgi:hypothetical protein